MADIGIATREDAAAILALQKLAYQTEARLYDDWTLPPLLQTLESLRDEIQHQRVLKATEHGALIGSVRAGVRDGICHIGTLFVHPDRRGRGLGTALLAAIERQFAHIGQFELFTGSRSEGNIGLDVRCGYTVTATRQLSDAVTLVFLRKTR